MSGAVTSAYAHYTDDKKAKGHAQDLVTLIDHISQVTVYRHQDENTCGIVNYLGTYQKPQQKWSRVGV